MKFQNDFFLEESLNLLEFYFHFQESPSIIRHSCSKCHYSIATNGSKIEIHGFTDASESAYGACFYLKAIDTDCNITVNLIPSKSQVAPVQKISLPTLELCVALLLSQLCKTTVTTLHLQINSISYYTNSKITLMWIKTSSHRTTIVANCMEKILIPNNISMC